MLAWARDCTPPIRFGLIRDDHSQGQGGDLSGLYSSISSNSVWARPEWPSTKYMALQLETPRSVSSRCPARLIINNHLAVACFDESTIEVHCRLKHLLPTHVGESDESGELSETMFNESFLNFAMTLTCRSTTFTSEAALGINGFERLFE